MTYRECWVQWYWREKRSQHILILEERGMLLDERGILVET